MIVPVIAIVIASVLFIVLIIAVVLLVRRVFKKDPATDTSTSLITAGLSLVVSSFPGLKELVLSGILSHFGVIISTETDALSIICGVVLIGLGLWLRRDVKDRIFVLNMYGLYAQRDISDAQAIKDLNLADFKVKELILDFVDVFKMPMDEDAHNRIIHKIDKTCEKFTERSRDRKSCFTGMAPIPYTIYAGTKLAGSELRRYFEYRRADSKYYELSNQKRKKYDALKVRYPSDTQSNAKANEVLITVSITNAIVDADLQQFGSMEKIDIGLDHPKDNIIVNVNQLDVYCQEIVKTIEELKTKYSCLKRVYLAASIPSCVSMELGKKIALNRNRLPEIVSVHYMNSMTPKYPFGVVVSGDNESYGQMIDMQNEAAVV